jgi:hypothetical protein
MTRAEFAEKAAEKAFNRCEFGVKGECEPKPHAIVSLFVLLCSYSYGCQVSVSRITIKKKQTENGGKWQITCVIFSYSISLWKGSNRNDRRVHVVYTVCRLRLAKQNIPDTHMHSAYYHMPPV